MRNAGLSPWTVFALFLLQHVYASTVTYDFNISWVRASPDGILERSVIGINGQWPLPSITASVGDRVVVNVHNSLGNQSTSLHFHGLFMNGTARMDGTSQVSQCAILPGSSFTYNFTVEQPGTYWYHSHVPAQYPDGLRGLFIVKDPDSPYQATYDEEIVLSLSDWFHKSTAQILPMYMSLTNIMLHDPKVDAYLVNDTQNLQINIKPSKTYMFRVANIGAFSGQNLWIDGHTMRVIEVDGVYTKPKEAEIISLSAGQRCSFLLTTKDDTSTNYLIATSKDAASSHMGLPDHTICVSGWLVYDSEKPLPRQDLLPLQAPLDDIELIPLDEEPLLPDPDTTITLSLEMHKLEDGVVHWMFNNVSYHDSSSPALYRALSNTSKFASDPAFYDRLINPHILKHNQVIEISLYNKHMSSHPFHLHGHNFQIVHRSPRHEGEFNSSTVQIPSIPARRDTIILNDGGNAVIRFRADNPGVWLFHCHMEWHARSGLVATMIEAPDYIQKQEPLSIMPFNNLHACTNLQITSNSDDQESEHYGHDDVEDENEETHESTSMSIPGIAMFGGLLAMLVLSVVVAKWTFSNPSTRRARAYSQVPIEEPVDM